jgi:hypothetical protein
MPDGIRQAETGSDRGPSGVRRKHSGKCLSPRRQLGIVGHSRRIAPDSVAAVAARLTDLDVYSTQQVLAVLFPLDRS